MFYKHFKGTATTSQIRKLGHGEPSWPVKHSLIPTTRDLEGTGLPYLRPILWPLTHLIHQTNLNRPCKCIINPLRCRRVQWECTTVLPSHCHHSSWCLLSYNGTLLGASEGTNFRSPLKWAGDPRQGNWDGAPHQSGLQGVTGYQRLEGWLGNTFQLWKKCTQIMKGTPQSYAIEPQNFKNPVWMEQNQHFDLQQHRRSKSECVFVVWLEILE